MASTPDDNDFQSARPTRVAKKRRPISCLPCRQRKYVQWRLMAQCLYHNTESKIESESILSKIVKANFTILYSLIPGSISCLGCDNGRKPPRTQLTSPDSNAIARYQHVPIASTVARSPSAVMLLEDPTVCHLQDRRSCLVLLSGRFTI